jgi:hypothetical protein
MIKSSTRTWQARCAILSIALVVSACAKGPPPARLPNTSAASPVAIDAVQAALMSGDERSAKKQLKLLLKRDPLNPSLLVLQNALQADAKQALGPESYSYKVRPGDTIETLASRLLGNRLKAYELARYNDLDLPARLNPGQTLRIPGSAPVAKPQPRPERPKPKAPSPSPAKPSAAPAPRAASQPAQAQRARTMGLAALNRGAIGQAIAHLERAKALDPGNVQIQRELDRARRIAATVKGKK